MIAKTAPADPGRPDVIVSAALYLMSSFGRSGGCPRLAQVILRHLRILAGHDQVGPILRQTCAQMAEQWDAKLTEMLRDQDAAPRATARLFRFRRDIH
ncbi:MAG: hypothetical protein JNM79_00780 [Burkholderiales bacterium]|nr:hypothetical protein [Burkholderiales bacterium]